MGNMKKKKLNFSTNLKYFLKENLGTLDSVSRLRPNLDMMLMSMLMPRFLVLACTRFVPYSRWRIPQLFNVFLNTESLINGQNRTSSIEFLKNLAAKVIFSSQTICFYCN